jgi:hypothetical protein
LEEIVERGSKVVVNARVLKAPLTGLQRYAGELLKRFGGKVQTVAPKRSLSVVQGHLWEQFMLPYYCKGKLLFSPANTGPLSVAKQVVTIHDIVSIDMPEVFSPDRRTLYRFLLPRLVKRVRAVITVSTFTRERLIEWAKIPPSHVHAIHLGVAQRELPDDVWLVVAGGEEKGRVFKYAGIQKLPPRVHLTGRVADEFLPALYSGALAFVFPSLYEGFGLPPLEAMACGTPVLASNVTAMPEVVGDAGLLVDPYDVEAIAHGIRRLVEDTALSEELRKKGLERAKRFTWERTAELTWAVLEEAMES